MEIGFTGSRHGMSASARAKVQALFMIHWTINSANTLRHGDCTGSDEEAFKIAKALGFLTYAYPASNVSERWLAKTKSDLVMVPLPALERNTIIVSESTILIATVQGFTSNQAQMRSGTWATVRYAKKEGIPFWLVNPLGQAQFYPMAEHRQSLGITSLNWND